MSTDDIFCGFGAPNPIGPSPPPEWRTFGDHIRSERMAARLSMGQLAKLLGVSVTLVSDVERGLRPLRQLLTAAQGGRRQTTDPHDLVRNGGYPHALGRESRR